MRTLRTGPAGLPPLTDEADKTQTSRHNADYVDNVRVFPVRRDPARIVADDYLCGYVGNTKDAYRRDLADYFAYCRAHELGALEATRSDVAGYLQTLRDVNRSASTVSRRLVALRGFYELAVTDYGLATSPTARIRIRRPRSLSRIRALNLHQLDAILAAADRAIPRTRGLAWLLATTGLRVSEACTARIDDISHRDNEPWLDVTCKGSVRRSVPLHHQTWTRLQMLVHSPTGPLFATRTGRCLDRQAAARDLAKVAADASIDTNFSPHVLRHTFVTLARQTGCSLEDVQDAAGHADPATTRAYDRTLQTHRDHPAHRILLELSDLDGSRVTVTGVRQGR